MKFRSDFNSASRKSKTLIHDFGSRQTIFMLTLGELSGAMGLILNLSRHSSSLINSFPLLSREIPYRINTIMLKENRFKNIFIKLNMSWFFHEKKRIDDIFISNTINASTMIIEFIEMASDNLISWVNAGIANAH
jgi:hypothetical protein